jgi:hypothetical protein
MVMARCGKPSPKFAMEGGNSAPAITNIRNATSPHWRSWLGPENRWVVLFTSFSEPERPPAGKSQPVWFALDETRSRYSPAPGRAEPLAEDPDLWKNTTAAQAVMRQRCAGHHAVEAAIRNPAVILALCHLHRVHPVFCG